jgi:hypothetical protein
VEPAGKYNNGKTGAGLRIARKGEPLELEILS